MRISSINSMVSVTAPKRVKKTNINQINSSNTGKYNVISMSEYLASPLSFKGRNKEQAIFYGAEVAPYSKAGGVGTVMKDYGFILEPKNEVVVSPYYKANVDKETGVVTPQKDADGDYVLEVGKGNLKKLDLVAEKNMQWGDDPSTKIMLFSLREEPEKIHYFVFDDSTAFYQKPYENVQVYKTGAKSKTNGWQGDPYAKNSKAFVELLPELIKSKKDFDPATIVCSDSQTAYAHEYMVQKALSDKEYDEIKTTHVGHNLGPGYCGETSMRNMFVNLGATPKQIEMVEKDPIFKQNILGDAYFKPFVEKTLDETGAASATKIALHHAENGFVKSFSVVAEDYADAIANNPQAAYGIHKTAKGLYEKGIFNGILNPLEDASVDPTKKLPNPLYNEDCNDTAAGRVFKAFDLYPANASYEQMKEVKNTNKLRLLERIAYAQDVHFVTGTKDREAKINPEFKTEPIIREDLMQMIADGKGDQVPLFVSWGRIDTQKGHDISLSAFEKFAKTEEGKNAIFILGAGLDKGDESKVVEAKVKQLLQDPELKGRIVHIDGWAPAYALASAADAAIFTSRFEPCGLTDIEAMKYYCSPIVTNTQGFKQKNFDPRNPNEADKATSFKTTHEFDLLKSQVQPIIDGYVNGNEKAKEEVQKEFPIFWKEKDGQRTYDDSAFVAFAEEYKKEIAAKEKELQAKDPDGKLPENWDDWNQLSKQYSFRYAGFARKLKDTILAEETAAAIKAYVNSDKATKELIFNNLKNLDTGWKGNKALHPTGQSSYELYKQRHMMADYTKPTAETSLAKSDNFIENQIEQRQGSDIKERVSSYLLGALTGLSALLIKRTNGAEGIPKEVAETTKNLQEKVKNLTDEIAERASREDLLNTKIKNLEATLQNAMNNSKKNMVIAGVLAAAGAVIATVFVTKKIAAKKAEKANASTPVQMPTPQAQTQPVFVQKSSNVSPLMNSKTNVFAQFSKVV